jgi:hypothetical protein
MSGTVNVTFNSGLTITIVKLLLVVALPFTSVAFTANVNVPADEGVPDISPEELKDNPVGRAPDATV